VAFWSFGSSLIFLGARETDPWRFVAIASLSAGALQLIFRQISHGELRTAIFLPWRLGVAPIACFVAYGLAWPSALAASSIEQVGGVNLINYLWPVLTILISVWWVPGVRLTPRMVLAIILSLAGLACANAVPIRELLAHPINASTQIHQLLPYLLASIAAITWAVYSALLARWRYWAKNYVTSPLGFVSVGTIASLVLLFRGGRSGSPSGYGLVLTFLYGVGPLASGYLLWELALSRARVQSISILAAATPLLSTLLLCCFLKNLPGLDLVLAVILVSSGVALSMTG
jgi:drug/metabolite transporter (DMT)-like permease